MPLNRISSKMIANGTIGSSNVLYNTNGPFSGDTNLLTNPMFQVRQGISYPLNVTGGGAYIADQFPWYYDGTGVTRTATYIEDVSANVYGASANIAAHTAQYMNVTQSGTSSGATFNDVFTPLQTIRMLPDGHPVTFSFYAKSSTLTTLPTVFLYFTNATGSNTQVFASNVTLTNSWVRYVYTGTWPTVSGTTRYAGAGWSSTGYTQCSAVTVGIRLPFADGNVAANIDLSTWQLEPGNVATPPRRKPLTDVVDACRQFYNIAQSDYAISGYEQTDPFGGIGAYDCYIFPVGMRTPPSCSNNWTGLVNYGPASGTISDYSTDMIQLRIRGEYPGMAAAQYNANNTFNSRIL